MLGSLHAALSDDDIIAKTIEPDEQLMAQVARDQREPLAVLLRRYGGPLLTFIQRMIGDRHRSEELFPSNANLAGSSSRPH